MITRPLRIGIISARWGTKCHLPAWRAVEGAEVTAICTSREETARAAAEEFSIPKAYWNYRDMIADPDIDLIDIGTRPSLRYHMAKDAIAAGKHIYASVPTAVNVEQVEELVRMADAKGVKSASDAYFQHIPAHMEMKRRIDAGEIGEIVSISLDLQINLFNPPISPKDTYFWFADKSNGASALRNLGTHSLTLLTTLFGEVEEAVGRQSLFLKEWNTPDGPIRPEIPDTATALLQFRNGPLATVNLSWIDAGPIGLRLDVHGSKGRLSAVHPTRFPNHEDVRLYLANPQDPGGHEIAVDSAFTHSSDSAIDFHFRPLPCYPMSLSFVKLKAAIEGLGTATPSLNQALHVERIIDAIIRSDISKAWESVAGNDMRVAAI